IGGWLPRVAGVLHADSKAMPAAKARQANARDRRSQERERSMQFPRIRATGSAGAGEGRVKAPQRKVAVREMAAADAATRPDTELAMRTLQPHSNPACDRRLDLAVRRIVLIGAAVVLAI